MKKWLLPGLCALPVLGVLLWFAAGKNLANFATLGLFLACPLGHFFLMKHDHGDQTKKGGEHHHEA